ncbi:MAG: thioesterase family protein [bacterium]|nr:thioesterase family protein [bacterium]
MEPHDLSCDTAVTRLAAAPGWYTADLPNAWDFRTPSGGVLMTVAMRAMQAELGEPDLVPLSANTHFCSPVPAGPLEIRVEVLRRGNVAAQVRCALSSTTMPGPGLEVSATFGRARPGVDVLDAEFPPVAMPGDGMPIVPGVRDFRPRFLENFECRLALGSAWWTREWAAGPARMGRWFRYHLPPRLADGRFDPLAIPPIADTMPPALVQRLGPDAPPFHAPSLDLTVHFLEDTPSEWLLTWVHARRARAGWATADCEIWDDRKRLVAIATQMMMIRRRPEDVAGPNW